MNTYWELTTVRVSAVFTSAGAAIDPTTVTCQTKNPSGTVASVTATKDSTGHYHADVATAVTGHWHYLWKGVTGATTVTERGAFDVQGSGF